MTGQYCELVNRAYNHEHSVSTTPVLVAEEFRPIFTLSRLWILYLLKFLKRMVILMGKILNIILLFEKGYFENFH